MTLPAGGSGASPRHLTLLTDLYQFTMVQAHVAAGTADIPAVFDLYFRKLPFGSGYAVAAGLQSVIEFISDFHFTDTDIAYLQEHGGLSAEAAAYLRNLRFTGSVRAVPEGTVVFPGEPILQVIAPVAQAQLLESALLNLVNYQTLIATKASRIVQAAAPQPVLEFGLRRAQAPDAAVWGARAAVLAGCKSTSNVLAGQRFGVPISGTHAHSWVQFFDDEEEAFRQFAASGTDHIILLVDTYSVRRGVERAARVLQQYKGTGKQLGIRLDSGDLAYLSKVARKMLDDAGLEEAIIVASSDLDEHIIRDLRQQDCRIDAWGVGTKLITAHDHPALGGVYKIAARWRNGAWQPLIKLSENPAKVTTPGLKRVLRFYDAESGIAHADVLLLHDEPTPAGTYTIFDPVHTWKRKTLRNFRARELLIPVFHNGQLVYEPPSLADSAAYHRRELESIWAEHRRFTNPEPYPVDLSEPLWQLKHDLIASARRQAGLNGH